jgi:hypothetical protein
VLVLFTSGGCAATDSQVCVPASMACAHGGCRVVSVSEWTMSIEVTARCGQSITVGVFIPQQFDLLSSDTPYSPHVTFHLLYATGDIDCGST